jgi:hypothetical protein
MKVHRFAVLAAVAVLAAAHSWIGEGVRELGNAIGNKIFSIGMSFRLPIPELLVRLQATINQNGLPSPITFLLCLGENKSASIRLLCFLFWS